MPGPPGVCLELKLMKVFLAAWSNGNAWIERVGLGVLKAKFSSYTGIEGWF
jgi:hypothetical protein